MKSLLNKIFIKNWKRKIIALFLAIITWFFVHNSLCISKTIFDVPIRVINIPEEKAIIGIQNDGTLPNTTDINIQGNKFLIDQISKNDIEILINLSKYKNDSNKFLITKNNIISKNSNINTEKIIKKLLPQELPLPLSKIIQEKIPIIVTPPLGEVPENYRCLNVWPNSLYVTINGPEETIKKIKTESLKLTLNINKITKEHLEAVEDSQKGKRKDVLSYYIPIAWKTITIPEISPFPIQIDDPNAKCLRIDFIKKELIPITKPIPVVLFYSTQTLSQMNQKNFVIANNDFVKKINGIDMITTTLYAQGISEVFLDTLTDNMFILILVEQKNENESLNWNIQPALPLELEKVYINKVLKENPNDYHLSLFPQELLKVRFRSSLNNFRLWASPTQKLKLNIFLENNKVHVIPDIK